MIINAQLQRVDVPASVTGAGDVTLTPGAAIAIDCCVDEPTSSQKFTLGVVVSDATAVLYVAVDSLPAGVTIAKGGQVIVQLDGFSPVTYQVLWVVARVHGGQTHYEAFLKGL